jgi:hypothetical protein
VRLAANIVLFQAGWFACVLGAAWGHPWAGPAAVAIAALTRIAQSEGRSREALLLLFCGVLGFAADTALISLGLFAPVRGSVPAPWSPPWLVAMWINFGATLNVSLAFLKNRPVLAVALGAAGGPAAYYAGARLGAIAVPEPVWVGLTAVGAAWAVSLPAMVWLAGRASQASALLQKR